MLFQYNWNWLAIAMTIVGAIGTLTRLNKAEQTSRGAEVKRDSSYVMLKFIFTLISLAAYTVYYFVYFPR